MYNMEIPIILTIVLGILFVGGIILLLHHAYSHRAGGPHPLEGCDQFFQESDVCNFHSCSHEMWILGIVGIVIIFAICAITFHFVG